MNDNGIPAKTDTIESLKAELEVANKRIKDTQAEYTRSRQLLKAEQAKNKEVLEQLNSIQASVKLPDEIEQLKLTNPDEWYAKKQQLEQQRIQTLQAKLTEAEQKAIQEDEKAHNSRLLEEFLVKHPDITEDFINYDIPHRMKLKLEKGEVSFAQFLDEVGEYHTKGVSTAGVQSKTIEQPNLSAMGNGVGVSNASMDYDSFVEAYSKSII